MVDARRSSRFSSVACFEWKQNVVLSNTGHSSVVDNLCQGSYGAGFSINYAPCGRDSSVSVFDNNLVGSASIGHLLHGGDSECSRMDNLYAYSCGVGVFGNPVTKQL